MLKTIRQGRVELLDITDLPESARVLLTVLPDEETEFWLKSSQESLDAVWRNDQDDIYAQLLQK